MYDFGGFTYIRRQRDSIISFTKYNINCESKTLDTKNNISHKITTEESPTMTAIQLKTLFRANPVPTYIWQKVEKDFKLIDYNEAAALITKGKIKNYIGIKASELYNDMPDVLSEFSRCFTQKATLERNANYKYQSTGESKHLAVKYVYAPPDLIIVLTRDISNWHRTDIALKESENKYQTFIEKTEDGIIIAQYEPVQIVFASPAMAEITGYSIEELKSLKPHGIKQLIHPEDLNSFAFNYKKQLSENQLPLHLEFRGIKKDGFQIWLSVSFSKITYEAKPCVLTIFKDVTEREQAKEKLKKINQCFLNFGSDSNENINKITTLCGELMGGVCALYNRLDQGLLCSKGQWHTPPGYNPVNKPEGHICYDVIKEGSNYIWELRNLHKTKYQKTDPNVIKYKFRTYIGRAVKCGKQVVGSICVVYDKDFVLTPSDREIFGIIVSAIAVEEERLQADNFMRTQRDLAIQLAYTNNLDAGLRLSLETAIQISEMDRGAIYLINDSSSAFDLKAHIGYPSDFVEKISHYEADSANVKIVLKGKPIYTQRKKLNVPLSDFEKRENVSALAVIPINYKEKIIGCMIVGSEIREEIPVFSRNALEMITAEIGSVIAHLKAEQSLQESQETTRALLDASPDIEFLLKPDTTIIALNEAAALSLGKSVDKLVGTSPTDLLPPEVLKYRKARLNEAIQTRKPVHFEDEKEGKYFETTFYPIMDKNEKVYRVAVYARNITEQKNATKEKERFLKKLTETEKLTTLGQIAAAIAHEINNPLDIITTKLYLLEKSLKKNNTSLISQEYINKIKNQVIRLTNLTKDILKYAKPVSIVFKPVDLHTLIQDVIEQSSAYINDLTEIKMNFDINIGIIKGDAIGLEIVFKNIILNALEARENKIKLSIATKLINNRQVKIIFKDTGSGISEKNMDKLFEAFYTTKQQSGGTGLGLTITQKIVEKHKGTIKIVSVPQKGTTVTIQLPIEQ